MGAFTVFSEVLTLHLPFRKQSFLGFSDTTVFSVWGTTTLPNSLLLLLNRHTFVFPGLGINPGFSSHSKAKGSWLCDLVESPGDVSEIPVLGLHPKPIKLESLAARPGFSFMSWVWFGLVWYSQDWDPLLTPVTSTLLMASMTIKE